MENSDVAKSIANDTNKNTALNQPKMSSDLSKEGDVVNGNDSFKVGDQVRATYRVDNRDYEAEIIEIKKNGMCVVKFIGYENEQNVRMVDLVDSWGAEQQEAQKLQAAIEAAEEATDGDSEESIYPKEIYRNDNVRNSSIPAPPIPPMPPMLRESLGEDSEHFSAMLMSWYMSGYYTGFYQGHKVAKQQKQPNKKSFKRN